MAKASLTCAVMGSELIMITEEFNFETIIDNSTKPSAQSVVSWARKQIDCFNLNCIILHAFKMWHHSAAPNP